MGYALPAAVGVAFATGKRIICIVGDGDLQFNVQELATIRQHNLPITIFVLSNDGYLAIKHTQASHFGRKVGSDHESGLWFPSLTMLADAYGITYTSITSSRQARGLETILGLAPELDAVTAKAPLICEVDMPPTQALIPRVSSKKLPDGSIKSTAIEDMYPFLPRDEFKAQMIVSPVEVLGE